MRVTTEGLKAYARSVGADLVGVAGTDRFQGAPEGHRPSDILVAARSVAVCALRLPRGVMDAVHRRLDEIAVQLAIFLESGGGKAISRTGTRRRRPGWVAWGGAPSSSRRSSATVRCIKACPAGAIVDGPSVDQSRCRPVVMQRLPKGQVVEACWECRKVCPVGAGS